MDSIIEKIVLIDSETDDILSKTDKILKEQEEKFNNSLNNLKEEFELKNQSERKKIIELYAQETEKEIESINEEYENKKRRINSLFNNSKDNIELELLEQILKTVI